jgi:hypothetical protein
MDNKRLKRNELATNKSNNEILLRRDSFSDGINDLLSLTLRKR